jgi:antirestriction protein ArdC
MAEKNKERLKEITDSIEQGIQSLFQSDRYAQYLRTMSRFHRYSVNNTMLIYMQKPDATLVAGFNKWRDQFSRNVMRGEKGIKIIAPTPFKKKIEEEKLDPDTKAPVLDADGKVIMEEKEIKIPMYKVVSVFDVSQTEGKPLPMLANDLTGM